MNKFLDFAVGVVVLVSVVTSCDWHTLRATCDNIMTVYVDGVQQHATGTGNWKTESVFPVSTSFQVIAIKCHDQHYKEGILASLQNDAGNDVLVTDGSWKCSNTLQHGWTGTNFNANWQAADVIGSHGMSPWGQIGQISNNAKWIWTQTRSLSWRVAETAYCRYSKMYTLRATCDNRMTVYVDGALQHAAQMGNWKKESVILVSSSFQVIAIKAVDYGGYKGLLASVQDAAGNDVHVTDGSWKCSDRYQHGWAGTNFNANSWQAANVIGAHGMYPWRTIGQISGNAKWIWSRTGNRVTYCRYEV